MRSIAACFATLGVAVGLALPVGAQQFPPTPLRDVRAAASRAANSVDEINVATLAVNYAHGKTLEGQIAEVRKTIVNVGTYADHVERGPTITDLYFLNIFVESLHSQLEALTRNIAIDGGEGKTDRQYKGLIATATNLTETAAQVARTSRALFTYTLAFYEASDRRLAKCPSE
jgi:hypothetical protein